MPIWNPWHGCKKISEGCKNCYVYRRDSQFGKDSSKIQRTNDFDLPVKRNRKKEYKLQREEEPVYTCLTSDFLIENADGWRQEVWDMIHLRQDLSFVIITKRIHRFMECVPDNWGEGYENVTVMCTCENQRQADNRLPVFLEVPIRHKQIIHEPMLEEIHIEKYLESGQIEQVVCGGESGENARLCDYAWILSTRQQCIRHQVNFYFKQTGALFQKENRIYHIKRKNQIEQAHKAGIHYQKRE